MKPRRQVCLNVKNLRGETPLLIAAKSEKLENIKCFIQLGANLNHEPDVPPHLDTIGYHDKLKILENSRDISHKVCFIYIDNQSNILCYYNIPFSILRT